MLLSYVAPGVQRAFLTELQDCDMLVIIGARQSEGGNTMHGMIYEPKGRAREYAALACNVYSGCDHRCTYCYAPAATFRDATDFGISKVRPDFLRKLNAESEQLHTTEHILLSFTCDPYQRIDETAGMTRATIKALHAAGLHVQVLTKGGTRALRDLSLFTPKDAFATSLTLL